jgi:hypothetical protein
MTAIAANTKLAFRTANLDSSKPLVSWGSYEKAVAYATSIARKNGETSKVADMLTGEVHRVTATGRVIDGHSVALADVRGAYHYKTTSGHSATNQYRVNRSRVLVEGTRCRVQGVRGAEFIFVRIVKNGDREWVEVREIERDDDGMEHVTRFRAFRPERMRTSRGWNS